ncbi:MAG: sigma-70 family RNA polymerase sigma factor [Myxococcota bacterium]|nr:sigma-70 family RNA polymerase sigma factor [Myxococcota bacterium]
MTKRDDKNPKGNDPASGEVPEVTAEVVPVDAEVVTVEVLSDDEVGDLTTGLDEALAEAPTVSSSSSTLPVPYKSMVPEELSAYNVYLARLKDVEILPLDVQAELALRYQATGDPDAAARLVASNLRLVVKIAFQFRRQWADVMDLIAEGNVGLAEAIRKFDADRGVPFPSYARFWIRARILAFIQENKHLIHAGSRAARKLFWRLERERRALLQEGLEPTPKRIAERVGVDASDVEELAPILDHRAVSLDVPMFGDEDAQSRGDALADTELSDPEEATSGGEMQGILRDAFAAFREELDERDRAIWDRRLQALEPERLEDLGDEFGVSKERVRQLEVRIKKRLKSFLMRELGDDVIVQALH